MKLFLSLLLLSLFTFGTAQQAKAQKAKNLILTMDTIEGLCDTISTLPQLAYFLGLAPESPVSINAVQARFNANCSYLKDNPKTKGEGYISLYVNCEGELLGLEMGEKKKIAPELEKQMLDVVRNLGEWKPLEGETEKQDGFYMYRFRIKKGIVYVEGADPPRKR